LKTLCHSSSIEKLDNLSNGSVEWIDIGSHRVAIGGNIKNSQHFCCESNEFRMLIASDYAPHFYEFLMESGLCAPSGYFAWDSLRISSGFPRFNVDFDANIFNKDFHLIQGEVIKADKMPFGGEPIVNVKDECFGYVTSARYRGDKYKKYFIGNLNADLDALMESELRIKCGDAYAEMNICRSINLPQIKPREKKFC